MSRLAREAAVPLLRPPPQVTQGTHNNTETHTTHTVWQFSFFFSPHFFGSTEGADGIRSDVEMGD